MQSARFSVGLSARRVLACPLSVTSLMMQAHVAKRLVLIVLLDSQGKLNCYGDANRIKQLMEESPIASINIKTAVLQHGGLYLS